MLTLTKQLCAVALVLAANSLAHAEPEPSLAERAAADAKFREGKTLLDSDRLAEACVKFDESLRLFPRAGTMLNLAACRKRQGRLAEAWGLFNRALTLAQADGRQDRVDEATREIAEIEPKLAWLTVDVSDRKNGTQVTLDGAAMGARTWGTELPVDPGPHVLEAHAEGYESQTVRLEPLAAGERKRVGFPELKRLPGSGAPPPQPAPSQDPRQPTASVTRITRERDGLGPVRMAGFIVGAVGLASLTMGGSAGIAAVVQKSDSDDGCPGGECTADGWSAYQHAGTSATIANVGLAIGAPAVLASVIMLIVGDPPIEETRAAGVRVWPKLGPTTLNMEW